MAVFVRLINDTDTADTDICSIAVGNLIIHADSCSERIQVSFTQTVRPPEFRVINGQIGFYNVDTFFHLCLFRPGIFDTVSFDVQRNFTVFIRYDLYTGFDIGTFGGYVCLVIKDIINACIIPSDQIDGAPDTAGDDAGSPVPTIMITGFTGKDAYLFIEDATVFRLVVASLDGEL